MNAFRHVLSLAASATLATGPQRRMAGATDAANHLLVPTRQGDQALPMLLLLRKLAQLLQMKAAEVPCHCCLDPAAQEGPEGTLALRCQDVRKSPPGVMESRSH